MQDFTNNTIDTTQLPRFEEVELSPLHQSYIKIIWINIAIVFGVVAILAGLAMYFVEETVNYKGYITIGYILILLLTITIQVVSYRNRGFAFRTHDVIYRSGAIAITTTIIPYNRVQHVELHEGWVSRIFGLATINIFTAGGVSSDLKIPGVEKEHAEAIKQLLVGKITDQEQKQEEKEQLNEE
ncbi:hypothetical protein AM493_03685 [Flavobacterium akiainvivens]|uniref:YdbS-like PH domain-containing protein n=2 Tax=Flavobacterium akiainvivens TaxID=1202724 RepID=A0A0M8MLE2_9FLAO|nr:hypothetical protein AM493_03685 [Flavobacterium akiainvivens]